jgi:hypothetical protein
VKIILLPDLFSHPAQHVLLVALISHALEERHRLDFDRQHPAVAAWLNQQGSGLREDIDLALDASAHDETREPSHTVVEVTRLATSDFERTPIRLHLADAQQFLGEPFVVLLEDQVSDRGFLTRMMSDEERRFFDQRVQRGFVRIDHGGGLGSMTRRVAAQATNAADRHRLWVLFDSDAMQPGQPSRQSEALRDAAGPLLHHQLRRRYMESYLPRQALHAWAANEPNSRVRDERLARFRSFVGLTEQQRHHYNMKHGFRGDADRADGSAGTLYDDVSEESRRTLGSGFGSDIGDLFQSGEVSELDLRRDTGWEEMRPVVRELLARVR